MITIKLLAGLSLQKNEKAKVRRLIANNPAMEILNFL